MEFELDREQIQIQKAVRDFVKGEFKKDIILELEEKHEYPQDIWKKAAELGFIGIHFPEEYSGQGLGIFENILVAEELCRGDSTVGTCLALADSASEIILHFGSEAQKSLWLPKVAEGEVLSCAAFTSLSGVPSSLSLASSLSLLLSEATSPHCLVGSLTV